MELIWTWFEQPHLLYAALGYYVCFWVWGQSVQKKANLENVHQKVFHKHSRNIREMMFTVSIALPFTCSNLIFIFPSWAVVRQKKKAKHLTP